MIFLDANVLLQTPTYDFEDPIIQRMSRQAGTLLAMADRGDVEFTTSEAVLAEVAFILTAKSHDQLPVSEAAALLGAVVSSHGLKLSGKRTVLRGLDLWSSHPRLGFVDALATAYAQLPGMQLATFDRELMNIPNIQRWQFADSH